MSGRGSTDHAAAPPSTALSAYRHLGTGVRAHTVLRWRTAPFEALATMLPTSGRILDFGCGHGLLSVHLALRSPGVDVLGVDVDAGKLETARSAADRAGMSSRLHFEVIDPGWLPEPNGFAAVVIADVLYVLDADRVAALLSSSARAVQPGGVVVVKEMADGPRWRRGFVRAQEFVSVRLAGITHGGAVRLHSERAITDPLAAAGMTVSRSLVPTRSPHPHVAFVARSPHQSEDAA